MISRQSWPKLTLTYTCASKSSERCPSKATYTVPTSACDATMRVTYVLAGSPSMRSVMVGPGGATVLCHVQPTVVSTRIQHIRIDGGLAQCSQVAITRLAVVHRHLRIGAEHTHELECASVDRVGSSLR